MSITGRFTCTAKSDQAFELVLNGEKVSASMCTIWAKGEGWFVHTYIIPNITINPKIPSTIWATPNWIHRRH